jgi:hypothetical protein
LAALHLSREAPSSGQSEACRSRSCTGRPGRHPGQAESSQCRRTIAPDGARAVRRPGRSTPRCRRCAPLAARFGVRRPAMAVKRGHARRRSAPPRLSASSGTERLQAGRARSGPFRPGPQPLRGGGELARELARWSLNRPAAASRRSSLHFASTTRAPPMDRRRGRCSRSAPGSSGSPPRPSGSLLPQAGAGRPTPRRCPRPGSATCVGVR